jgi:hypothetical protein
MSTASIRIAPCQGFIVFVAFNVGLEVPPIVTKTSRQGGASSPYADVWRPFRAKWNNHQ